jgi:hypothetical protein
MASVLRGDTARLPRLIRHGAESRKRKSNAQIPEAPHVAMQHAVLWRIGTPVALGFTGNMFL